MTDDAGIIYRQMPPQPSENIEQTIPDCQPADSPVLFTDDEAIYQLVLQVTAEQWVRLFSAATAGADLLYPDTSLDAVFPLRQAVDCMPTFCQAVEDCIETTPAIINILIQITNYWGEEGEDGENPPVIETNPVIANDCDLDNLFGACTQMVDLANTSITDIFEIIEAITNSAELANEVLELIPGLNFLASVLDIANVLQEQLAENYAAAYTSTIRDELRCALFCACQEACTLDWDVMTQVFADLAGQSILTLDIQDFVDFFVTGTWSGDEVVYASFWFMFGMMSYGGRFWNLDADKLAKMSASFLNDPDSDWETLCTDCQWSHTFDFTADDGGWQQISDVLSGVPYDANWSMGVGWRYHNSSNTPPFGIIRDIPIGTVITKITVNQVISLTASGWAWYDNTESSDGHPRTEIFRDNSYAASGSNSRVCDVLYTIEYGWLALYITRQVNSTITVSSITITGQGDDPFI